MTRERRLGRGLEALLGGPLPSAGGPSLHVVGAGGAQEPADQVAANASSGPSQVGVHEIEPSPFQPRREFDEAEIDALAESLKEHGLLQPVLVRRIGERFQLVAGERRLRAAIKAGWAEVPVQVVDADDRQTAEIAIVENLQRKDLNPLEKAASFQRYLDTYGSKQEELAQRLHIDRSTISNLIRLLELPDNVQQALRSGAIGQGHARALLPLGDEREQSAVCRRVIDEGLSVRAVESLVQDAIQAADAEPLGVAAEGRAPAPRGRARKGHLASLEQELRAALGTKVDIRQGAKGRGRIVIHFAGHEEYERLHRYLTGEAAAPKSQAG